MNNINYQSMSQFKIEHDLQLLTQSEKDHYLNVETPYEIIEILIKQEELLIESAQERINKLRTNKEYQRTRIFQHYFPKWVSSGVKTNRKMKFLLKMRQILAIFDQNN